MWGTNDPDWGVTYGGFSDDINRADIYSASTYSHADPSANLYGASSDRDNSSCRNQAGSHRNAGTSAHRAS